MKAGQGTRLLISNICIADRADPKFYEARGRLRLRHWTKISSRISVGSRSKPEAAVFFWLIGLDGGLAGAKGFCFNRLLRLREENCRSTGRTQERMSQSKLDVIDV